MHIYSLIALLFFSCSLVFSILIIIWICIIFFMTIMCEFHHASWIDPKNVIVSQGNNHFLWNWDCADFCWCCGHWFISLNGTTSVKRTLASVTMLNCHSGLFLSIFSIPGMVSPGKMEVSLTTDMKRCVDSVLLSWDHGRSAKWQRNQTHLQHGASWVLVGEPV